MRISLKDLPFKRLRCDSVLKPFNCDDDDLNDFFCNDAINHLNHLLAVTYVFETQDKTVAFFSVLNDKIINKDESRRTVSRSLIKAVPHKKQRPTYPAVKIGRFAVHRACQKQGIGTDIIIYLKTFFTTNNRTGCRFLTVDAYCKATDFYMKNGFRYLSDNDKDERTRLMYFDLKTW